ncbi:hypothetical protein [Cesiribacter andamanensis]|uniref:Uncharacterized protein n=1 Tax=Cesiribacter andamanensis AMV16 TaxID=1279009 RepID=M7NVM4_9BACT|nr:hypothetical protein [Cesiribacter andamanensis]EMR02529.1 hypothetical protein ADICEAN_02336 [Cesiribacter andamanensis AMV16]
MTTNIQAQPQQLNAASTVVTADFTPAEATSHLDQLNELYTRFMNDAVNDAYNPEWVNKVTDMYVDLREVLMQVRDRKA